MFEVKTADYFRTSGIFLSITALTSCLNYLMGIYFKIENGNYKHTRTTGFELHQTSLLIFMLICGLAFILISYVLKESITYKQENELTI